MLIPELVLYNTLRTIIDIINADWQDNISDPTKTILYDLFNVDDNGYKMILNKFVYFDQAKAIFIKDAGDSRRLQVTVGYNLERLGLPTIHILLPQEVSKEKGIGYGQGYQPMEINETDGTFKRNFTDVSDSTYNMMITSDNSSEVVLIYHAMKNLFTAIFEHFELSGLRNITFGGQDLQFNNELVPPTIFHRNLTASFFYESTVNEILPEKLVNRACFKGTIIDPNSAYFEGKESD